MPLPFVSKGETETNRSKLTRNGAVVQPRLRHAWESKASLRQGESYLPFGR